MADVLEKSVSSKPNDLGTLDKLKLETKLLLEGTWDGISQRAKEAIHKPWVPVIEGAAYTAIGYGVNALSKSGGEMGAAAKLVRGGLYCAGAYNIGETISSTFSTMVDTWKKPDHFEQNKGIIAETLGAKAIDYAIMFGANAGISKLPIANSLRIVNEPYTRFSYLTPSEMIKPLLSNSLLALGKAEIVELGTKHLHNGMHKVVSAHEIIKAAQDWAKSDMLHKDAAYKKLENLVSKVNPSDYLTIQSKVAPVWEKNELPFHFKIDDKTKKLTVEEDLMKAEGIDISGYSGKIDWKKIQDSKDPKLAFVLMLATEGKEGTKYAFDDQFETNWQNAKKAGITRGAYHFYHPSATAQENLENFKKSVTKLEPGDLPPILDVETESNGAQLWDAYPSTEQQKNYADKVIECLEAFKKEYGINPILYTNQTIITDILGNDPRLANYPLWYAMPNKDHTNNNPPSPPQPFSYKTFWQYSWHDGQDINDEVGKVSGINESVDKDTFNGTLTGLSRLLKQ